MLRINVLRNGQVCLWLEGNIDGAWVEELRRKWQDVTAAQAEAVSVHLHDVGYVDDSGVQLLREIHQRGDKLTARGVVNMYLISEIVGS